MSCLTLQEHIVLFPIKQISVIISDIQLAFSNNESVTVTYLDIYAAYDSVLFQYYKYKLFKLGIPIELINFIINLPLKKTLVHF